MQPQVQALPRAGLRNACAAAIVKALHGIGGNVGLSIEIEDAIVSSPSDAVLERDAAAEINADPVLEGHHCSVVCLLGASARNRNIPFAVSQPIDGPAVMRPWGA